MKRLFICLLLTLSVTSNGQNNHELIFKNIKTGIISKINKGDYLKIYAMKPERGKYQISGTFDSINSNQFILKNKRIVQINEIQKIKYMPKGTRIQVKILNTIGIIVAIGLAFLAGLSSEGASQGTGKDYGCLWASIVLISAISLSILVYRSSFKTINHFQTEWELINIPEP